MKRILKYIFIVALAGALCSCVDESSRIDTPEEDGEGVYLTMSLSMPQMQSMQTRGVLDNEDLNPGEITESYLNSLKIYMFIFENVGSPESNYLRTFVHGEDIRPLDENGSFAGPDSEHQGQVLYSYKAKVDGTSENAIIHLVATADPDFEEQLQKTTDRSELGLFYGSTGLYTSGQYPAFWKRIDLGMPISAENLDDKGGKPGILSQLSHVQMIRNFCRITVKVNPELTPEERTSYLHNFRVLGYAVVNQVDNGYVAAYNENGGFQEFENTDSNGSLNGEMKSYGYILDTDKYTPARHPASQREHKEETLSWLPEGEDNVFTDAPKYMFERPYQDQHRTYVVVKGDFGDGTAIRYIKLDVGAVPEWKIDENGFIPMVFESFHFIRNFSYDIIINTVASTNVGAEKVADAIAGLPANNVSASIETRSIQNISDGRDRMWVSKTKFVIVDDDNGHPSLNGEDVSTTGVDLWWRYVVNYLTDKTNVTDKIRDDYPGMELKSADESGIFRIVSDVKTKTDSDGYGDWRGKNITFNAPDDVVKQKTIRLYYADNEGNVNVRLSRDVTFVMRKRWEFVNKQLDNEDKPRDLSVEVYAGAYSYDNASVNPPYNTLKEMRENVISGKVGSQGGAQLTVMFELPEDLPQAIFPLDFTIGFDRQNVENALVGNATAITGSSLFEDDPGDYGPNVPRIQYLKTVTWEDYNGDDVNPGRRLVCVRFTTINDVLNDQGFDGTEATTRVRVFNPYFAKHDNPAEKDYHKCEGRFIRQAHEDAIDPTRTYWYWNFSYPEWATYFNTYPKDGYDPHNLNNLSFDNNYGTGSRSGTYMTRGETVSNITEDGRSQRASAFYWPVDFSTSDYRGAVVVRATVTQGRNNRGGGAISGYTFDLYDRDIYVTVITVQDQPIDLPWDNNKPNDSTQWKPFADCNQTAGSILGVPQNGDPKDPEDFRFPLDNIPDNTRIKEIRVWSTQDSNPGSSYKYTVKADATRYYSIKFTLTPN